MKKIFTLFVCALVLVLVTGCGKNQVVCTATMEEAGQSMKAEVVAEFDGDDKVKSIEMSYELSDEKTAETYCSLFKLFTTSGENVEVDCSGKKITIKGLESIDMDSEDEADKIVGKTKAEFIELMEKDEEAKFTCKK